MSSDKQGSQQSKPQLSTSDKYAVHLALLARDIRNTLRFHKQIGLETYPAREGLLPERPTSIRQTGQRRVGPNRAERGQETAPQPPVASTNRKKNTPVGESLRTVLHDIESCTGCDQVGVKIQPAAQDPASVDLMIVGDYCGTSDSPRNLLFGEQEDVMLWRMVEALGLKQPDVYVTNCMKCRCLAEPKQTSAAVDACLGYLSREVIAVRPKVICAMGGLAAQLLVGTQDSVLKLRGRFHPYRYNDLFSVQVMVTYHPRFLLAHPEMKRATWEDLQLMQRKFLSQK